MLSSIYHIVKTTILLCSPPMWSLSQSTARLFSNQAKKRCTLQRLAHRKSAEWDADERLDTNRDSGIRSISVAAAVMRHKHMSTTKPVESIYTRSTCSLVKPTSARSSRHVECLLPLGLLCTLTAPKPGVAKWLSCGGTTVFGITPKNAWNNTLLGVMLTTTVSNVVTHVTSSGVAIGVPLEVWIVSCVLTRPSRCSTTHKTGCPAT